jgi:hypothetical protein
LSLIHPAFKVISTVYIDFIVEYSWFCRSCAECF